MVIDKLIVREGVLNKKIDSYQNLKIEEISVEGKTFNFAKQKDVEGINSVVCDNAVNEPFRSVEICGNTNQQIYEGKNLATAQQIYEGTSRYEELTEDERNCIRFADATRHEYKILQGFKENAQYTVSFDFKAILISAYETAATTFIPFVFFYTDGTRSIISAAVDGVWKNLSLTSTAGKTVQSIGTLIHEYRNYGYIDVNTFQLEEGTTATSYEPYVGGVPAPNPEYPQDIVNAGDSELKAYVKGKNLLNIPESFTWTGVVTGMTKIVLTTGNYTFSCDDYSAGGSSSPCVAFLRGGEIIYYYLAKNKKTTIYIKEGQYVVNFYANGYNLAASQDVTSTINKLMLEEGTVSTAYEPYAVPEEIVIPQSVEVNGEEVKLQFGEKDKLIKDLNSVKYIRYSPNEWDNTKIYQEQWLENPLEYDLTNTELGQRLLELTASKGTNFVEILSETIPVSGTKVSYWRQIIPNEEIY